MKPSIATFLMIAIMVAFIAFVAMSVISDAWATANFAVVLGVSFVIGIFLSALICVIAEPVEKGTYVILPSNI